jgi:protocatechuate 3,4-dioxygenase alpha subunit
VDHIPIPSQTVGPFFHLGCTDRHCVGSLVSSQTRGEHMRLRICVLDGQGVAVPDAMIEIWQANADGKYSHPDDSHISGVDPEFVDPDFKGFGRLPTDESGCCTFETIRPGQGAANGGGKQASHFNISVFARGILNRLATRAYFSGDPELKKDLVLALVPADRQHTLLLQPSPEHRAEWYFEIHLCGANETVFFDI